MIPETAARHARPRPEPAMSRPLRASEQRVVLIAGDTLAVTAAVMLSLWTWSITAGFPFDAAFVRSPRLLHGVDATAWTLLDEAAARRYDGRIGLEDTLTLPDGRPADGNGELVRTARQRVSSTLSSP